MKILGTLFLCLVFAASYTDAKPYRQSRRVNVTTRFVNDSRACNIIKGVVTLKTQTKTYTSKTGKRGFASFKNIPCGQTAALTVSETETYNRSSEPAVVKIPCKKSAHLGTFNIYYGNKVSEARANFCYRLNPN